MAEVVNSLFGITPESLQAQRDQALQQEAMQYAKMDPFQRATAGIYAGANKLGGAIGGMLGAQDPEMMRITQRQSLLQQAQPTNAKGWSDLGSQLMQRGDIQGAQEAYAKAQALTKAAGEAEKTQSEIEKNKSEAVKNLRIPTPTDTRTPEEKNAVTYALTKGQVGTPEYKTAFTDKFVELTTKEGAKPTKVGVTSDGSQRAVYSDGKTQFVFANDAEGNLVKKNYIGGVDQTTAKTNINTEIKQAPNIVDAVNAVDKATEKEVSMMDSAKLAKQLINETAKSNNSQTWEAARTTVAKAVGESKLSNEDIRRTGVDPRLVQGALDWVNKKIEGVPTPDIQQQLYVLVSVLENSASARYDAKVKRYRGAAEASKFPGNPSTYFPTAAERTGGQGTTGNVVEWSSMGSKK